MTTTAQALFTDEEKATLKRASNGEGVVNTFIDEKFYDGSVTNEAEAEACVKSVLDRIGGDETTELVPESVRPNEDGMTVVTFVQRVGGAIVCGAVVKLVLDKDGQAIGLISSIMPNAKMRPLDQWACDSKQAEQIVLDKLQEEGAAGTVVDDATKQLVLPVPNTQDSYICAWLVFTSQAADENAPAFTAHYVDLKGTYLYAIPVSGPDDPDALAGQSAKDKFDFDAYEPSEITVSHERDDGTTHTITVPVLKDAATGKVYLADAKRKILCADQASYLYQDQLMPIEVQDGANEIDADTFDSFIQVWDFYNSVDWTGPDGDGTPALLLMNYVDFEGKPVENASYLSKHDGFQIFTFTRAVNYGECLDVVAHEYTHCVTGTNKVFKLHECDPGAINEGMSDIMGNLIEMRLEGDAGAWTMSEGLGKDKIMRDLSNPHEFARPAFAFDTYYAPLPLTPTKMNDTGGVHINSTLLSLVSYRLHQAGMGLREQSYFWLNVALVTSPQADYPMMAKVLPWVMKQLGYDQYVDALKAAIDECKFTVTEDPGIIPEGYGAALLDLASIEDAVNKGMVCVAFFRAPNADLRKRVNTWPAAGTTIARASMPAGDYYVAISLGNDDGTLRRYLVLGEDGWVEQGDAAIKDIGKAIPVAEGQAVEITNEGLGPIAIEQIQKIEQAMAAMSQR